LTTTHFVSNNTSKRHVIFYPPNSCLLSSIWPTHQMTNGSTSNFHFGAHAPSNSFQHALQWGIWDHCAQILSCSSPRANACLITQLIFLTFRLFSPIFFIALCIQFKLPHPSIAGVLLLCTSHRPYGDTFYVTLMATHTLEPMM
jgi:hypothetical protein